MKYFIIQNSIIFLVILELAACGSSSSSSNGKPPTIDSSTPQTFEKTLSDVRNSLPKDRWPTYDQAITELSSPDLSNMMNPEVVRAKFKTTVNGLTGEEIIAAAKMDVIDTTCERNERLPRVELISGIFASETAFQKGVYNDQNANGIGEFASLGQLGGTEKTLGGTDGLVMDKGQLNFLAPDFVTGENMGYRYVIYLPNGSKADDHIIAKDHCEDREKYFVCYAWPVTALETGAHIFAITQDGKLYFRPSIQGEGKPTWNDLFHVKTGDAKDIFSSPSWKECPKLDD